MVKKPIRLGATEAVYLQKPITTEAFELGNGVKYRLTVHNI
jgi:hypothetical protein